MVQVNRRSAPVSGSQTPSAMASDLENAMSTIVETFHSYASEGDCLAKDEFQQLMQENCSSFVSATCPPDTSDEEYIHKLFTGLDGDENGCIAFHEFAIIMANVMALTHTETHPPDDTE
ncbi:protein S100-A1-like isoform X2 [Pelodiscus sinensis]|uniref:protein S100-A1-like isoform X2 n=1 Tax=Pelodiscus sinensis TaxID=13735 RepID=UPI003F6D4E74